MKIYGEQNTKRCVKLGEMKYCEFVDDNSPLGFIREHGMLGEYMAKMHDDDELEMAIDVDPKNVSLKCVEYGGEKYWYGTNCFDTLMYNVTVRSIGVYRELPDVFNDTVFHWKDNKKYGSKECVIEDGMFEFHCIYKADGNAIINVKYCACDNPHRNKVTISTIEVEYASNAVILKGIRKWKTEFKKALDAA